MAQFPTEDSEVIALARRVARGFIEHVSTFPQPPVPGVELQNCADAFMRAREKEIAARRNLEAATRERHSTMEALVEKTKVDLNYAEQQVCFDDRKLQLIGWHGKKPQRLLPPGAPRSFEIVRTVGDMVELDWKKPAEGEAQSYRIEMRLDGEERWTLKGFSLHSDTVLQNMPRGKRLFLRVIAVNKIGDSQPSEVLELTI